MLAFVFSSKRHVPVVPYGAPNELIDWRRRTSKRTIVYILFLFAWENNPPFGISNLPTVKMDQNPETEREGMARAQEDTSHDRETLTPRHCTCAGPFLDFALETPRIGICAPRFGIREMAPE
jgi:hypothetical protein